MLLFLLLLLLLELLIVSERDLHALLGPIAIEGHSYNVAFLMAAHSNDHAVSRSYRGIVDLGDDIALFDARLVSRAS